MARWRVDFAGNVLSTLGTVEAQDDFIRVTKISEGEKLMARWRVDIRGKELQQLGTVDAPNAWEALARALDLFDVRPALRSKTVVSRP
jgi:hypothetical protein